MKYAALILNGVAVLLLGWALYGVVQLAQALGMTVIAEGVETEGQRQFLLDAGCGEFQGFLYSPGVDSLSFERLLGPPPVAAAPPSASLSPELAARRNQRRIRLVRG